MTLRRLASSLLLVSLLLLGSCEWTAIDPMDPDLGQPFFEKGDERVPKDSGPSSWTRVLVLENGGPAAPIAFRATIPGKGTKAERTKTHIPQGGRVAVRVGPEDVGFMFYSSGSHPQPVFIDRLEIHYLELKHPGVPLL